MRYATRLKWDEINPSKDLLQTILSAVEAQKKSEDWNRNDGQYIPSPTRWLDGRRWEDELPIYWIYSMEDEPEPEAKKPPVPQFKPSAPPTTWNEYWEEQGEEITAKYPGLRHILSK